MKIFVQNVFYPSQVLSAFDEIVDQRVCRVRWAMAYSTLRGCQRLVARVSERIGLQRWEQSEKIFVTSIDFGLTEPAALRYLAALPASHVFVSNSAHRFTPGFMPDEAYRPKVYLFDSEDRVGYVVGSANLTDSGLLSNSEVVAAGYETPSNAIWDNLWQEIIRGSDPITEQLITEYETRRRASTLRQVNPEPLPQQPNITASQQAVFWDAVTTGRISPRRFDHFWVRGGSMSSGGSHNQLELPRGANLFFGFNFSNYGSAHRTIGSPIITLRAHRWTDRPLTWHGHNRMERINLPTQYQGGFDYRDRAILFRRHPDGFEINAVPWNDSEAIAWRAASNALRTVFRLGEVGRRICGLF
jgi:hypothetical protein